jgi:two-component system sensor histidine kinase UhpB
VFYKIIVANAVILSVAALIGGLFIARLGGVSATEAARLASILGASAVVVGAVCSALLTRLALTPLRELEASAERVEQGDLNTRAAMSPLADRDMRRLVSLFNRMLDRVELYRSRQREVTVRSLESEENARRWVARKLYDDTAQSLAAVLLHLRAAGQGVGDAEAGQFENLRKALIEALESIRQVARELRPPELDEIGLVPALAAQARNLSERSGIEIHLDADSIEADLSTEEGLALYRIVSEALGNAARHAGARSVDVHIVRGPSGVSAEIHDNGAGFDVDAELERAGRGLGLLEMRERALHVGAELSIQSSEADGTTVSINMPFGTGR